MSKDSDFTLYKWYLDCVADNGDTLIGYSAALRWKALTLLYSSITTTNKDSGASTKTSLRRSSFPRLSDGQIEWSSRALNVTGTWRSMAKPIQRSLFNSSRGIVMWSCMHPRSKVDIAIGKKKHLVGLGYAELLELTIKPWQLPITDLRWGRFLSERDVVIWIEWRGTLPLSLVFLNGEEIPEATISDEEISMGRDRTLLTLTETTELRKGPLISTALSAVPKIDSIVPARMLNTYECKWKSRGVLSTNGSVISSGWAIHEVVRFP